MRRLLAVLACLVLLPGGLSALCEGDSLTDDLTAAERAEIAAAVAATPFAEGLFWRATRDGTELRLIGTMHVHDPRNAPLAARADGLLDGADLLLLELTPAEEAQAQRAMVTEPDRLFITSGPTLPERLAPETWAALSEAARARQIPPFVAAKFQPWYLAMSLALPACAMPDLMAGRRGLDHALMDRATERGIPMQALEAWDTLFDLMSSGTPEEELDMLRLSLVPQELQSAIMVAMLDGYFAGRIAEVWETSRVGSRRVPGLEAEAAEDLFLEMPTALLDTRNRAWMPVIAKAAAVHDTVVIAVGAAHLPGEAGLLRLLERDGWSVTRITE